jgi:mono/diheme cytochrome c family protein
MRSRITWTILVLILVLILIALVRFNLSALQEPGRLETLLSNQARHSLIHRASRQAIPPRPADTKASSVSGSTLYTSTCGFCHGSDGRAQTPIGQWTYPRAADLTSTQVQSYSDQELFWIIQNGIRFTGMPAFGKVESGDDIWNLVNYVRTLSVDSRNKGSTKEAARPEEQIAAREVSGGLSGAAYAPAEEG